MKARGGVRGRADRGPVGGQAAGAPQPGPCEEEPPARLRPRGPALDQLHRAPGDPPGDGPRAGQLAAVPLAPLHGGLLMAPFGYPVMLEVAGRRVRRDRVAPRPRGQGRGPARGRRRPTCWWWPKHRSARLDALAELDGVRVERRPWRPTDLDGAWLVVAHDPASGGARRAGAGGARPRRARERDGRHPELRLGGALDRPPRRPRARDRHRRGIAGVLAGGPPAAGGRASGPSGPRCCACSARSARPRSASLPDVGERARRWGDALDLDEAAALVRDGRADGAPRAAHRTARADR